MRSTVVALLAVCVACGGAQAPSRIHDGGLAVPERAPSRTRPHDPSELGEDDYRGEATWYGPGLHGNRTANGERFDMYTFTAAHRHLPFNTIVRVTRTDDRRSVVVRINDRGPYGDGRVIDLAWAAAWELGFVERGHVPVELEVLAWGDGAIYEP